jgi:hypothetical protein
VLLFDPGAGEALEIPATFAELHDQELVDEADAALAASFFEAWVAATSSTLPLGVSECVGYRTPLFLGGIDDVSNLDRCDVGVYWSLMGQLRLSTQALPPGTSIGHVDADG